MKMKVTDLMDNLPIELLEELDSIRPNILIQKKKNRIRTLIYAAAIMVALLGGCSAYVALEMPATFHKYFRDSNEKLVDEMYINYIDYVDYENYRLSVEGIVSDVNSKKILITVIPITDKAKENFKDTCPTPIIIRGGGSQSMSSSIYKYKKEFLFELESSKTECSVILYEGIKNNFEFYTKDLFNRINEITEELMSENKYSRKEAYDIAGMQAIKEKVGKILSFSIASKDNSEIILDIKENNNISTKTIDKIALTKSEITIYGSGMQQDVSEKMSDPYIVGRDGLRPIDIEPTVYATFDDGTEKLLLKGNMGYAANGSESSSDSSGQKNDDTGNFERYKSFAEPIDLDRIVKIRVNDIEYLVNK